MGWFAIILLLFVFYVVEMVPDDYSGYMQLKIPFLLIYNR